MVHRSSSSALSYSFFMCVFVQTLTTAQFHTNIYVLKYLAQICCESLMDAGIKFRLLFLKRLHMVYPLIQLTFSQISPGTLESSLYQSLELTSSSLAHYSLSVWSSLPDSLGFQSAPTCLNHVRYVSYFITLIGCPCMLNLMTVTGMLYSVLLYFPFLTHSPTNNVCY